MGKLTRKEMEAILRGRESVMYDGRVITEVSQLPSEAELAKGDVHREAEARKSIEYEMTRLKSELELLNKAEAPKGASGKAVANQPTKEEAKAELSK
jgi:hypothetical protein